MIEFSGRTALVTGGGSGIGEALALALGAEGAAVVVADLFEDRAADVVRRIEAAGGTALAVACDVSDRASVRAARARALQAAAPVSLLFANAGVTALKPMTAMSADEVDWIMDVNLMGVIHCMETFLPDIVAHGGHVTATSSVAGLIPEALPTHAPYVATKLGLIGLMLNLRQELAQAGVGCTVLCPDGVATRIAESPRNRPARFGGPSAEPVGVPSAADVAKIRFRPPQEVARMVLRAVRDNRPMVLTDSAKKALFLETYVDVVLAAFDEAARFDAELAGEASLSPG